MNHLRYDKILSRLSRVRWHNGSQMWSACCPAHDDRNPSLWVWIGRSGNLIAKCKSRGCSWESIREATGTDKKDWFPEQEKPVEQTKSKLIATYEYHDEQGKLLYVCKRWEPGRDGRKKDFSYSRPQPDGKGWINNLEGVKRVPYRLPELLNPANAGRTVFIVEGEKKVDALRRLGLLATCNPCGAKKWERDFGKCLAGRPVAILPDNDEPGWDHAWQVCGSLILWEASAIIGPIHLPGLPDAGDVCDYLNAFPTGTPLATRKAALLGLVKQAKVWTHK